MTSNQSSAEIAAGLVDEAEALIRLEIQLAKQELKEMAITNVIAAGSFAAAGFLALLALLVGIPLVIVLAVEPHWLAAIVWLIVYLLLAAGLALFGRTKLKIGVPERTVTSLKETRNWALRQMRSPGR